MSLGAQILLLGSNVHVIGLYAHCSYTQELRFIFKEIKDFIFVGMGVYLTIWPIHKY